MKSLIMKPLINNIPTFKNLKTGNYTSKLKNNSSSLNNISIKETSFKQETYDLTENNEKNSNSISESYKISIRQDTDENHKVSIKKKQSRI